MIHKSYCYLFVRNAETSLVEIESRDRHYKQLITLRASCGAVYCNRSCLWVGWCVCVNRWVCYHDNSKMRACIDPNQTGFVGRGGVHLQLIKFWPSRAPGNGVCRGAKFFGSALLQPARSACVSSERFFHFFFYTLTAHYYSRFVHCSIVCFFYGREAAMPQGP